MTNDEIIEEEFEEVDEIEGWETVYTNEDDEEDEEEEQEKFTSDERVRLIANIADTMKATNIVALDLRPLTTIADFFLICTGSSSIQIRGIADKVEDKLREAGIRKLRMEGFQEATWILLDYGDVIVHVMAEEQREYYRLEEFWKDAEKLELDFTPELLSARTVYIRDLED